jgi:hypothetical protein
MSPKEIAAYGRGFVDGSNAARRSILGPRLMAEREVLAAELVAIKAELAKLHVLALAEPERPIHWSMH